MTHRVLTDFHSTFTNLPEYIEAARTRIRPGEPTDYGNSAPISSILAAEQLTHPVVPRHAELSPADRTSFMPG